ncbi:MAG TPA: prolyl oligopeptidase family serine peptidase, partial [Anaeromyxobacter sp.]|nr:prolyl oligopeptidase family serine peptidase [Anaeromyxobacter sp.]
MATTPPRLRLPLYALVGLSLLLAASGTTASDHPPAARVAPVVDDYFGTKVTDPYRWMEAPDNGELTNWLKEQALQTRRRLDRIPSRTALLRRIHDLGQATSEVYDIVEAGGRYFYFRSVPGEPVPKVFFRDGLAGSEHLLLDPARLAPAGGHAEIGFLEPSNDGRYLAYGLAFGGSDWGELHIVDVVTGESQGESISRIWTGFDDKVVSWAPDNRSFCYQRFPELGPDQPPAEKQLRSAVYLHTLGRNTAGDGDPAVFGFGVNPTISIPKEAWSAVWFSADSAFVIAGFAASAFDVDSLYWVSVAELSGTTTPWRRIVGPEDQISANPLFNSPSRIPLHGSELYLMSHRDAPRFKVLRYDLRDADLPAATVAVPGGGAVIEDLETAADGLFVLELRGGPSGLRRLAYGETTAQEVSLPFSGTIRQLTASTDAPGALLRMRSWTRSNAILAVDPLEGKVSDTGWQEPARADFSTIESHEVKVVSLDGTLVPLSILMLRGGKLDGKHPTLLESYGAYGAYGTAKPYFDPTLLAWLERGGVFAVAHPRGGGELGEDWHRAGMKQMKLNTVFDTIACAQYLVNERYA